MTRSQASPMPTLSATGIAAAVGQGRMAAVEVAEAAIARIEAINPALNAIVGFASDRMREAAHAVDRRVAAGERLPLAGVPVAIKDNIWVEGRRVTQGSRLFADFVAPEDAVAVKRLRQAGAIIAGMANTSEFAAKGLTTNLLFGPTRHPMDPQLTPGGSSGGPAVSVAAGLVPLALGTDAGGSSRRPPAHVGVVGFKPSFEAVPYGPGFAEPFVGLSVMAPIARTVADAVLMFQVLVTGQLRLPATTVSGLRVAFSPRLGLDTPVDDDVADAVERAIAALGRAGVTIERRDPVWPAGASEAALMALQHAGLAAIHGTIWQRQPHLFDPDIGRQIERGLSLSGVEVAHALQLSSEVERSVAAFFSEVDLLLAPTTPCVAWPLTQLGPERIGGVLVEPRGHAVFTPLLNHAKVPAISIPCGNGRAGLPVGLQIIGARGSDRDVLAFAAFAERAMDAADDAPVEERHGR